MSKSKDFVNVVIVGDSQTGKTSLLCALKDGKLTNRELPEFFQAFTQKMKVDGRKLELGLWDTSGEAKYEGLRRLSYPQCDVFVVCYSVNSRQSFENVSKVWLPELEKYGPPNAPVIIVATKLELRPRNSLIRSGSIGTNSGPPLPPKGFVNYEEGLELANKAKAYSFIECSSFSENGVNHIFEEAVKAVFKSMKDEKAAKKIKRSTSSGILKALTGK